MKISITTIVFLLVVFGAMGDTFEQIGEWSTTQRNLKARLVLKHRVTPTFNGVEVLAYLELCNTCPPEGTIVKRMTFAQIKNMTYVVKDKNGVPLDPRPLFCSTLVSTNALDLVLPQDGTLRFCISMNGGGVSSNETLLYLKPGEGWYFPHSEKKSYTLSATLSVGQKKNEKTDVSWWYGTLDLPAVRIPVPSESK